MAALPLALVHARFQFTETIRVPIAVISTVLFPSMVLLFFVVPTPAAADPTAATAAAGQLAVFSALSTCLFTFGVGVAEDRALPWDPYVRTLPAGSVPRLAGRLLNALAFTLLGLAPIVLTAALFTEARVGAGAFVAGVGVLITGALPFLFAGFAIGYAVPVKGALGVAQLVLFPMAFGGGLFLPPWLFPGWLDRISTLLPTRGSRDLLVAVLTGQSPSTVAVIALGCWTLVLAVAAGWAYHRDEGRRYR